MTQGTLDVGFIGLGSMGQAMASRLLHARHKVRVWSRAAAPSAALGALGAEVVKNAADTFGGDALISMLSDDAAVRSLLCDGGVLPDTGGGTIHINMATVSVAFTKYLESYHSSRGIPYIAAPVFGRAEVAAAGNLNILAAGDEVAIRAVQPLFNAMGKRTWVLGSDPSKASVVKIAGNFLVASAIEALSEAIALCRANGIAGPEFMDVIGNSIFDLPVYKVYGGMIAAEKFEPAGFKLALGLKDIRLALAAGEGVNTPLPLASILRDHFLDAIAHGDGEKDWAALGAVASRRAGLGDPLRPKDQHASASSDQGGHGK